MPHQHTKPGQHDQTASAFIIRTDGPEPRLMLHRHKKLGFWLQFGGHVELDENPWQAITHELLEESGYQLSQLKLLQPKQRLAQTSDSVVHPVAFYDQTHNFPDPTVIDHRHTDRGYVFFTDQEPSGSIADGESSSIKLFTLEEIQNLKPSETPENIKEIAEHVLKIDLSLWNLEDPATV